MAEIENFKEFLNETYNKASAYELLRGMEKTKLVESNYVNRYAIQITFPVSSIPELLLEHNVYTTFRKTRNRYLYHPEDTNIPAKAHYHVYPPNGKKELYAVSIDGTAHHQKNKGIQISNKEADELRSLGVTIPLTNIIESLEILNQPTLLTEGFEKEQFFSVFIMIG